jgi:hypothetical protein
LFDSFASSTDVAQNPDEPTMRPLLLTLLVAATAFGAPVSGQAPRQEIDSIAAFARLFGVVRYFYPSDAAASLDWDRFAVHGVKHVRAALDAEGLAATLEALFSPLGPGIEIGVKLPPRLDVGDVDSSLIAWRYLGAGMAASSGFSPYKGKRTHRSLIGSTSIDGFVSLMQTIPALSLRGKTIRLRGQVRATPRDMTGSSALWLRVDRPGGATGFFDNMSDRPVRLPEWREYGIEGMVADDATSVAFGAMASGAITADFDAIDLSVRNLDGAWTSLPIKDHGFEAAANDGASGWNRVGTSRNAEIARAADHAPEGGQYLRFSPARAPISNEELFESAPMNGAHVTIDLSSGLWARVRLALSETEAGASAKDSSKLDMLRAALDLIPASVDQPDADARLAGVVVAWNVFRHFYPYWTESGVDWDARLRPQLELAYAARTRDAQRDALRQLVADARDGHGGVVDARRRQDRARLPIQLGIIDGRLVVTASALPADVPVGAVVSTINGIPATERMAEPMRLASGTTQWKRTRALQEIASCENGAIINLAVDSGTGPHQAGLRCVAAQPPAETRPAAVAEVTSGVWYVDLTRAPMAQITPVLDKLAQAAGVVFDVRGYPTDAGAQILPYLIDAPEDDRWMHVAKIIGPFGQSAGWQSFGWNLKPRTPRLAGKIVFLTDERAISYAESVMGYVADRKLGTIIGSTTAGTNGNVAMFPVPGGFTVTFTGMRVTGHDSRTPHHLVGIKPDIPIAPTLAALREGRDEVLNRAVALISGK